MADSLVSGLSTGEQTRVSGALLAGIHYGATLAQHRMMYDARQQAEDQRIQAEQTRQVASFRQQWSLKAMELAQKAEQIRQQSTTQYFGGKIKEYNQYLAETQNFWDDVAKNPGKYDQQTVQGAMQNMAFTSRKRIEIAGLDPSQADPIHGIPQLQEAAPYSGIPQYNDTYLAKQKAQSDKEITDAKNADLRTQLLIGQIDQLGNKLSPEDKIKQKKLQQFGTARDQFQTAIDENNAINSNFQQNLHQYGSEQAWKDEDPQSYNAARKSLTDTNTKYQKAAPQFFRLIDDPDVNQNENLRSLHQHIANQFNGLQNFSDFSNATHYLHDQNYDDPTVRSTVDDYFHITLGQTSGSPAQTPTASPSTGTNGGNQ